MQSKKGKFISATILSVLLALIFVAQGAYANENINELDDLRLPRFNFESWEHEQENVKNNEVVRLFFGERMIHDETPVAQQGSTRIPDFSGRFIDQEGVNGLNGSTWRLYEDGTLVIDPGYINWASAFGHGPWRLHRSLVERVVFSGPVVAGTHLEWFFSGFTHLTDVQGLDYFDTSNVTSMFGMFSGTENLTQLTLPFDTSSLRDTRSMFAGTGAEVLDLSAWTTPVLDTVEQMFIGAENLVELDISNWNTSRTRNMSGLFWGVSSLEELDLSHFDTRNAMTMSAMFAGMASLTDLDISNFNTTNVFDISHMFDGVRSLTHLDLSHFNTISVSRMWRTFADMRSLVELDVSNFNTARVTEMRHVFNGASSLETLDLSSFNTANVNHMSGMFANTSSLRTLDLSNFNTNRVQWISEMFFGARNLEELNLSSFNTRSVTSTFNMFEGVERLRALTLGPDFVFRQDIRLPNFGLSNPFLPYWVGMGTGTIDAPNSDFAFTSEELMLVFSGGNNAVETFVRGVNENAPDISGLPEFDCPIISRGQFDDPESIVGISGAKWHLCVDGNLIIESGFINWTDEWQGPWTNYSEDINVIHIAGPIQAGESIASLFSGLWNLTKIVGLNYFDTSSTQNMSAMFSSLPNLTELDVSSFDTSNVTNMAVMFSDLRNLTRLDILHFDTSNVTDVW